MPEHFEYFALSRSENLALAVRTSISDEGVLRNKAIDYKSYYPYSRGGWGNAIKETYGLRVANLRNSTSYDLRKILKIQALLFMTFF